MHVAKHHTIKELESLAAAESHVLRHLKLRALILAKSGWEAPRIAEALGKSRRTIQQWVGDYNRDHLDGLNDQRGGNRRHLDVQQEAKLKSHIDATATDPERSIRHAAELVPWIEKQFGKVYSLSGLYKMLHRLGYSWLMPRPRHPKTDPQAQADFKKNSPSCSSASPRNTPANASKSGSRTKHASGNKAR